jgi:[methyl-Co(III) methanol-specific corrinoid protein]:coenzyme M methyltransferase
MSRQSFIDAVLGKKSARQPVFGSATSVACVDLMEATGAYFPQAHLDAKGMSDLAIGGYTRLGLDVVMPLYSVCHEVAALGCEVDWGNPTAMPDSKPIWSSVDDIRIGPDFLKHPACKVPLDAIAILRKRLGEDAAVCGKAFGPWTLAYHLFGVEKFLIRTLDDPAQTHRILERLLPVTVAFAKAQLDAGADVMCIPDHATSDLCSPAAYKEFLIPVHSQLARMVPAPTVLHICGNTSDRVAMVARTGINCLHWDTKSGPPEKMRTLAGDKLALMGGVSNLMLLNGKPQEIQAAAAHAHQAGIDIIGPECAIPLRTPIDNLKAIATIRQKAEA